LTASGELRARADEQARPVSEVLEDFRAALSYVCSKLSLINGNELPEPPSQGILL
jgi:hypothetical protein